MLQHKSQSIGYLVTFNGVIKMGLLKVNLWTCNTIILHKSPRCLRHNGGNCEEKQDLVGTVTQNWASLIMVNKLDCVGKK